MRNQVLGALIVGTALAFAPAAMAEHHEGHGKKWEEYKKLSPEEREKFHAERKAKWEAMSDAEKLKVIEERRGNMRKEMDDKWNSMSDQEKIKFTEERMKHMHKHKGDGKNFKKHGERRSGKPAPAER